MYRFAETIIVNDRHGEKMKKRFDRVVHFDLQQVKDTELIGGVIWPNL